MDNTKIINGAGIKRNSSFELMRLLCMFMIILGHCASATAQDTKPYLGTMDNIGWFIKAFTICSVNCFFLLTGYFGKSDNFRLSKVLELWIKTVFYSITIYTIVATLTGQFDLKEMVRYFFPVWTKRYWYMQTYLVASLLLPFLTKVLEELDEKKHTFLITVLIIFFSLHQTFSQVTNTLDTAQGYGIIWCFVLCIVGSWLQRYGESIVKKRPSAFWILYYAVISVIIFISNYLIVKLDIAQGVISRGKFYAYNSVTVFLQSLFLFCFFIKLKDKMPYVKEINWLAQNALAGYLISAHPLIIFALWSDTLGMARFWKKPEIYVLTAIVFSTVILLGCVLIDKLVMLLLNKIGLGNKLRKTDMFFVFPNTPCTIGGYKSSNQRGN